ncbi:hypothetical protein NADFUDRAFT_68238 [Nadsonia fulvescens var. elongata DSM 6958]|uniref:Purine-cytosine permease n=1 Tax=Nadsonia fulvescens var. elongata DSM 6958 TaxID=857566 RepID=A0A1E3PRB3_9ASCO|nr:hypothetical protein NADFUDRAFT_68238 [Nadsonia fulvescens var. elongata DSM 6958]
MLEGKAQIVVEKDSHHSLKNRDYKEQLEDKKVQEIKDESSDSESSKGPGTQQGYSPQISDRIDSFGLETRGIHRTPSYERKGGAREIVKIVLFWMSGCGGLSSISGFFLGPIVFGLSLKDSLSASLAGAFVGAGVAAYGATMGPRGGLRQMVSSRFIFGWWPAKGLALLNIITLLGWAVVNCVFGGQIISALSNGKVNIEPGIVIITCISLFIAIYGIKYVALFERWAAIPVNITFLLLYVVSARNYHVELISQGTRATIIGNWLSFFAVAFGITGAWIAIASDYYVTFPEDMSATAVITITWFSIFIPTAFVGALGVFLATGVVAIPQWYDAYETYGNGGLLDIAFSPWNGGGKFLLVMLYISLISNNILNTYSIALSTQVWGRVCTRVPRYIWATLTAVVYLVLALVGRNKLAVILSNFLPMIGYWSMLYFVIMLEENVLFRRKKHNKPGLRDAYDFENWNNPDRLPKGYAAFASFALGVVGVILGMCQVYYSGPVAKTIGDHGADLGLWISAAFTGLSYPALRMLENKAHLRYFV